MPFTKNPAIAKVFREIGYAEELVPLPLSTPNFNELSLP